MALTKTSGLIADLNGKLGGSCYARNRSGLYLKNWKVPANPPSANSLHVRNHFKNLSSHWRTLTDLQRLAWADLAGTITWYNRVGDPYHPSGFNLFMSCNTNLNVINENTIDDAPTLPSFSQADTLSITWNVPGQRFNIALTPTPAEPDVYYSFYITSPLSEGINYVKVQYRNLGFCAGNIYALQISKATYKAYFGYFPTMLRKYFCKAIPIHRSSGIAGVPIFSDCST